MPASLFIIPLRRLVTSALVALMIAPLAVLNAHAVTIDMVTVGDLGNANDTIGPGYGAVNYEYQIGKYAVTIGQYTAFLNAVAATDTYSLYNPDMATDLNVAGISRAGASDSYTYSVINNGGNSANRPITYVSWFDAARFANWMTNGQGSGSTETGAYTLVGGQTSGTAPAKNPGAAFYIPTENEWYKAAYYSPVKGGVGLPGYSAYATQSDSAPGNIIGSGTNRANYAPGGVYAVTQSSGYSSSQNYLTDVGAFSDNESFYGTFDQNGNVFQWNDLDGLGPSGSSRGLRGGYWDDFDAFYLSSTGRLSADPSYEDSYGGFRLASPVPVPEPSTWVMGLAGLACRGLCTQMGTLGLARSSS
jgi:formylglycine-generating enzyme